MMNRYVTWMACWLLPMASLLAQGAEPRTPSAGAPSVGTPSVGAPPAGRSDVRPVADKAPDAPPQPRYSDAARSALSAARQMAAAVRGAEGDARAATLEAAAQAYDKVAESFSGEPAAAAAAALAAAELWRRHGSFVLAEQDYLAAARVDAERHAQRGLLGAADMQRRLGRPEDALATYGQAVAVDATTARGREARLWRGRLLVQLERLADATVEFRAACEAAERPREVLEASDLLARALLDAGDLDGAAAVLDRADQRVRAAVESELDRERWHQRLRDMSVRKALQRARDKQTGAVRDAQDIESQEPRRASGSSAGRE